MGVTPSPSHSFSHARGFYKTRENNLHWSQTIPGCVRFGFGNLQTRSFAGWTQRVGIPAGKASFGGI